MKQRLCEVCGGESFRRLFDKERYGFYRCHSCQLIRIDPQPTDGVLDGIYGSRYYDAWGCKTGADRVWQHKKLTFRTHVLTKADLESRNRVLDCGAAFGALMEVVKENGGDPYGIELAAEAAAEISRRFGPDRIYTGPFEQATFQGLGEEAFDAVFMCDFIEHVRDPLAVLRKASKMLRPGGRIVITTPDGGSLSNRLMGAGWPHYKTEHLYYFNRHNISVLLKQAGIAIDSSGPAWKTLDLQYIQHQFNTYPRAVITPLINRLALCVGSQLRQYPVSVCFGEMIITGTKQ